MLTSSCRGLLCESFLSRATIQEKFTRSLLHETITRRFNSTDKPLTSRWPEDKKKGHLEPKKNLQDDASLAYRLCYSKAVHDSYTVEPRKAPLLGNLQNSECSRTCYRGSDFCMKLE